MSALEAVRVPESSPTPSTPASGAPATSGIALGLVAVSLVAWLASVAVFVMYPLDDLPRYFAKRYLVLDPTSLLFVLVINTVFLGISVYMLSRERTSTLLARDIRFRAAMTVVFMLVMNIGVMSNHLILMWALIEISTLCAAPLVARGEFKTPKTAAWRYMLYSAMTLAITFLGFMCLSQSADLRGIEINFQVDQLSASLTTVKDGWQRLGLAFVLFGLGGKLGLAPLYSWMPETYEAAPTSTSALLAAVQFNISVVAVFRVLQVFHGFEMGFVSQELLVMGYLSLIVAAVQIMAVRNYKRLIAYACVSSSGVIALGLSVGGAAAYGVVLYIVSNAFVKSLLFLTSGRMWAVYGTNEVAPLNGVIRVMPFTGLLFTVGIFALLGFPPFASFLAEMLILSGIVQAGNLMAFTVMCGMLTIIFVSTGRAVFPMLWDAPTRTGPPVVESLVTIIPKLGFVSILVMLGTYTPEPISQLLRAVAVSIGGV